jgi:Carboxypeptidase regulatory-like domain
MLRQFFLVSVFAAIIAGPLAAQSHLATIRGVILDPTGAPVPGATVRAVNEATGDVRSATTGTDNGKFAIPALQPGLYRVEAEKQGFALRTAHIELQVNQERSLDLTLTVGPVTERTAVVAAVEPVERDSAALSTVIEERQVAGLPLDGRNYLELSLLAPGTAPAPQGSASSLRGDFALTANGGREDAQGFLLDGVYNVDPKLNTPGVQLPVDAIQEFGVLTNGYDSSFGRNAAGQINVVTRSGTNEFRGSVYGFVRTRALNARNFFAPPNEPAPDYNREQVGGSIGGPIVRNRTFFFGDYEHTHRREGITQVTNVPTDLERRGNFSQSLLPPPRDPQSGQPFPNQTIPDFYINPVGRNIAALYPLPNRSTPGANFVSSPILRDDSDHFDVRVDQRAGNVGQLFARYSFEDRRFFEPFPSSVAVPGYGTDVPRGAQNLSVGWTKPFGAHFVNEARFAYSRVAIGVFQENQGRSINHEVGLPEISSNPRDFGLSQITVTGFSPLGDEFTSPQESKSNTIQILDNLSWASGSHVVKTGFDFRSTRQDAYRDVLSRGFLNFSDRYITGNGLADLLLGYPLVTGGAILDNPQKLRAPAWSAFVQDSWRLRDNLTVMGGLRYEYIAPAFDADNRATLYDPNTGQLVPVGSGTMPRGGYEPDRSNWAPHVSLAWTPTSSRKTVIRTGYGIYFNQGALATGEGLYFNSPYYDLTINVPFQGVPPITLQNPFPQGYPVTLPTSATAYQRDLKTPWLEHWNLSIQHQLGVMRSIEVAYAGSRGHDLIAGRDINQAAPSPVTPNLRPNPQFDDITFIESRALSRYNALQIKFLQRFDRGISVLSSYTYGKSTDDASGFFSSTGDPNFPQDSRNVEAEYGRSSFDVRHRFSTSFSAELPFGRGKAWFSQPGVVSAILGDMELQGIVTLNTGRPFTVALLPEFDNSNTGRSTLGFGANDRPNLVGNAKLDDRTPDRWFNTGAFAIPSYGSFGNAGRNILDGPGYQNINLGLLKNIAFSSDKWLQLRAEAFNLFNHTNFNLPDAYVGSPTFGRIVTADSPRRCQFGVKLFF